ncbi:SDR family oxidoreductase [Legionella sp. km772]|uniref:dTDP-4-dehydrorhamnose reductase family protein n=1 Tax=Legionella sp. km772 TaxID=2498111 RepID=UPI000F8F692E|nr:SDR family oxidoreductase [Legionella sp. km772]RUR12748.1 SDR family oxidoreductase [Legionella sp. km772]
MRVLILGITGMLGSAVYKKFIENKTFETWGTLRNDRMLKYFPKSDQIISHVDVLNSDELLSLFERVRPHLVINCVGLIKQLSRANDPLAVLPINTLFPHQLAKVCSLINARLIHISTDCVFSGRRTEGAYSESDLSDAEDLYGKSKYIGEITHSPHAITLRTSIIGHELNSNFALIDWFLSQNNHVKGYLNAIYSGLPTFELARVIHDYVIPNPDLCGLYHVSSKPISKYHLLKLVADVYKKDILIEPEHTVFINRALKSSRFEKETGYVAPDWPLLVQQMHREKIIHQGIVHV